MTRNASIKVSWERYSEFILFGDSIGLGQGISVDLTLVNKVNPNELMIFI